jgi:UDP-N-acetylglucosamine 2-epimerase
LPQRESIKNAIGKALSEDFKNVVKTTNSPYGDGTTSEKIIEILKKINFSKLLEKNFYDLNDKR